MVHRTLQEYLCAKNPFITIGTNLLCLFLSFVCSLYGFGQITKLQLAKYWCDKKDLETIYLNSIENQFNGGTNEGCWKSKQFTVEQTTFV